jgi:hypothetical protein
MSYASMAQLAKDQDFQDRVKVCATIECQSRLDDPNRADWSNLAYDTLRGADHVMDSFIRFTAQTQAVADAAGDPPDQSQVTDEGISTAVDAAYPVISSLWYNPDGTPWGGALHPPVEEPPDVPPDGGGEAPPPAVTGFSPASGPKGSTVTITGVSLTGTTLVNIGMDCPSFEVVDDATVTASINTGVNKGHWDVLVTVGADFLTAPGQFQVT